VTQANQEGENASSSENTKRHRRQDEKGP